MRHLSVAKELARMRRAVEKATEKLKPKELFVESVGGVKFSFWATQRPLTHGWGSGQVFKRLQNCSDAIMVVSEGTLRLDKGFGLVDVAFGKTDGIPEEIFAVDLKTGYDWKKLPFPNNNFTHGFWDPPYRRKSKPCLFKHEGIEIWRTCKQLAILHTHIWPHAWLQNSERIAMVAVTMGPMKATRCLQIFRKKNDR